MREEKTKEELSQEVGRTKSFGTVPSASSSLGDQPEEIARDIVNDVVRDSMDIADAFMTLEQPGGGKRVGEGWRVVEGAVPPTWEREDDPNIMTGDMPSANVVSLPLLTGAFTPFSAKSRTL